MEDRRKNNLNKVENYLFVLIVIAIISDLLNGRSNLIVFIVSTAVLVAGIIGIIFIEFIKLQWKQKQQRQD